MVPINRLRLRGIRARNGAVFPAGVTGVTYGARGRLPDVMNSHPAAHRCRWGTRRSLVLSLGHGPCGGGHRRFGRRRKLGRQAHPTLR